MSDTSKFVKPKVLRYDLRRRLTDDEPRILPHRIRAWSRISRDQLLQGAERLPEADIEGVPQAAWWEAFIRIAFDTGLRISDLLTLEFANVADSGKLEIVQRKDGVRFGCDLEPKTMAAIRRIATPPRCLILPWPSSRMYLARLRRQIAKLATIAAEFEGGAA